MKRFVAVVFGLLFLLSARPSEMLAQVSADNAQAPAGEASKASFFDNVSDWYATLGKTAEEKEKILQDRRDKRAADQAMKACEDTEAKARSLAQDARMKAEQGVAAAREKAATLKGEAKVKVEEKAAVVKSQAGQKVEEAKTKAARQVEACKAKLKTEMDSSLDKAKDMLAQW
jgi:flagellar biosynthesis/type III secretory pathway protein FliH